MFTLWGTRVREKHAKRLYVVKMASDLEHIMSPADNIYKKNELIKVIFLSLT